MVYIVFWHISVILVIAVIKLGLLVVYQYYIQLSVNILGIMFFTHYYIFIIIILANR